MGYREGEWWVNNVAVVVVDPEAIIDIINTCREQVGTCEKLRCIYVFLKIMLNAVDYMLKKECEYHPEPIEHEDNVSWGE